MNAVFYRNALVATFVLFAAILRFHPWALLNPLGLAAVILAASNLIVIDIKIRLSEDPAFNVGQYVLGILAGCWVATNLLVLTLKPTWATGFFLGSTLFNIGVGFGGPFLYRLYRLYRLQHQ